MSDGGGRGGGGVQLDLFGLFAPAVGATDDKVAQTFLSVPKGARDGRDEGDERDAKDKRGTRDLRDLKDGTDRNVCATLPPPPPTPPSTELVFARSFRARHYRLTLRRDGVAVVTIPARGSEREARRFAAEHADWLARARARQEKRPRSEGVWEIGTQILWRGEMTRIGVAAESTAARPAVALAGAVAGAQAGTQAGEGAVAQGVVTQGTIAQGTVAQGAASSFRVASFRVASLTADLRPALEAHFLRVAKIELPARAWELAAETRVPVTAVRVRNQRARWGSCTSKGVISLNWRLVQAPVFVRDYIIYHELMHLREMNHSARFWARVGEVCPFWQEAERWIKKNGGLLGL